MTFRPLRSAAELQLTPNQTNDTEIHEQVDIGNEIRGLRKATGRTLKDVASAAGISVGYLSEIERNLSKVPIGVLQRICEVFGVHINWFFRFGKHGPAEEREYVVRADNRPRLSFPGLGIHEELLSPNLNGDLEMLISTIAPGADSGTYAHNGFEGGLVLNGTLQLWIDRTEVRLNVGDSFAFPSTHQHRCANPGTTPTRVLWVITPPHY